MPLRTAHGLRRSALLARAYTSQSPIAARQITTCCYLQAGEACAYKRELLFELAAAIGITIGRRTGAPSLYREIRTVLAQRYAGGEGGSFLIIVDEATTLRPSAINMLRNLHDDPACRTAIVLADTIARMDGFLYGRAGIAGGNEQLRSRSRAQFIFARDAEISPADVKLAAFAALIGVGHTGRLPVRSHQYLTRLAQRPGALRNVTSRIQAVAWFAAKRNCTAEFTVAQLDWIGQLAGESCELDHDTPPFATESAEGGKADKLRRTG